LFYAGKKQNNIFFLKQWSFVGLVKQELIFILSNYNIAVFIEQA